MMKKVLSVLLTSIVFTVPVIGLAQTLDCPEPAAVFGEAGANTAYLSELASTVGTAELDGTSLRAIVQQIRAEFPAAQDADIADLMITSFCAYLNDDVPVSHRSEANVAAFEQQTYDAVFGAAPPPRYEPQSWLLGD